MNPSNAETSEPEIQVGSLKINVRQSDDSVVHGLRPEDLLLLEPVAFMAWRPPACFKNQVNLPGYFWISQTKQFIFYESRLEMAVLKQLDFEEEIAFVVPQPFQMSFEFNKRKLHHVPDFLVWRHQKPLLLVNVKPKKFMQKPNNLLSFAACRALTGRIRLEHKVFNEPPPVHFANVRWLAGYRREPYMYSSIAPELVQRLADQSLAFGVWVRVEFEESIVRPVAFHLMWKRLVQFDTTTVIDDNSTTWLAR